MISNKLKRAYKPLLNTSMPSPWLNLAAQSAKAIGYAVAAGSVVASVAISSYIIVVTNGGENPKPWESYTNNALNSLKMVEPNVTTNFTNPYLLGGVGTDIGDDLKTVNIAIDNSTITLNAQNQIQAVKLPGLGLNQTANTFNVRVDNQNVMFNSRGELTTMTAPTLSIGDYSLTSVKLANNSVTNNKISNQAVTRRTLGLDLTSEGIRQLPDGTISPNIDNITLTLTSVSKIQVSDGAVSLAKLGNDVVTTITNTQNSLTALTPQVAALTTTNTNLQAQFNSILPALVAANNTIAYAQSQIQNNTNNIAALTSSQTSIQTQVNSQNTQITINSNNIATNTQNIALNSALLQNHTYQIGNNTIQIANNSRSITDIYGKLSTILPNSTVASASKGPTLVYGATQKRQDVSGIIRVVANGGTIPSIYTNGSYGILTVTQLTDFYQPSGYGDFYLYSPYINTTTATVTASYSGGGFSEIMLTNAVMYNGYAYISLYNVGQGTGRTNYAFNNFYQIIN